MKVIGPTLAMEIAAANLSAVAFWWDDKFNVFFNEDVQQHERDAVLAVIEQHDPSKKLIPIEVSRYQGEVVMRRRGWYDMAENLFQSLPDGDERKVAWMRAPKMQRYSSSLLYAAEQLNIPGDKLDDAFLEASEVS